MQTIFNRNQLKKSSNYYLDIQQGCYKNFSIRHIQGYDPDTATTPILVSPISQAYTFLSSGTQLYIASDDNGDNCTVKIEYLYLDGTDRLPETQEITLTGQTQIALNNANIIRVNFLSITHPTSLTNASLGDIYIGYGSWTLGIPTNKVNMIESGKGNSRTCLFSTHTSQNAYVVDWNIAYDGGGSANAICELDMINGTGVEKNITTVVTPDGFQYEPLPALKVTPNTDIYVKCSATSNKKVWVSFTLISEDIE